MKNILVGDVMTRDPICVHPSTNLYECAKAMVRKRVGNLLLTEKKHLVGIISRKDILWAIVKKSDNNLKEIEAISISPKKIATIRPDSTINEAVEKMKKFKFRTLPVLKEKELVGLITIRDILNFSPEVYPELEEFAQIREEASKLKNIKKAKEIREGICEECGNFGFLTRVHGTLLCEGCRERI